MLFSTPVFDETSDQKPDLASLVASRICHDLLNPIGAIGNVVEMLAQEGPRQSEDMGLLQDCVATAIARLKYFRSAFTAKIDGPALPTVELNALCQAMFASQRLRIEIEPERKLIPAPEYKAILLLLLCVNSSLPIGGDIMVSDQTIVAKAIRINPLEPLWAVVTGSKPQTEMLPLQVHFLLLRQHLTNLGWSVSIEFHTNALTVGLDLDARHDR